MTNVHNKMSTKVLALFLTFLIIAVSVPMAFAAETLTVSSVKSWPTITYITEDKKMHFGQTYADAVVINDDEVVLDASGNQVAGHFEFLNPTAIPTPGTVRSNIKFVPDDTTQYTEFTKRFSGDVTFSVETGILVPVDHDTNPLVATEVEAGAELRTSVLSGGEYTNPYNPEEPKLLARTWEWVSPATKVMESGYYEAVFAPGGYEAVTTEVYVRIAGDIPETTIVEMPTFPEVTYDGVTTWGDIALVGGKAELKVEGTEVEGTFAISGRNLDEVIYAVEGSIEVTFTPADPEAALPYTFRIPFKVNPAPLSFKDAEGNIIADGEFVFEVEPKEKLLDVQSRITDYLNVPENSVVGFENSNGRAENGKEYTLKVFHDDPNYIGNELTFTAKFKETKIEPRLAPVGPNKWRIDCNGYYPDCQFIVYYEVNGVTKELARVNANNEFNLDPKTSGNYTIRIVYDKTEDDYFIIDEMVFTNDVKLSWSCSSTGGIGSKVQFGDTVVREAPETDPAKADKPYYSFVKWEDANGNTGLDEEALSNREITFTMPDGDVKLEATYRFDFIMFLRYIFTTIINWFESVFASIGTLF